MNINKSSIDNLVRNNKKISDILSKINEMKEEELSSILDEISKIKLEQRKDKKEIIDLDLIDKKITNSILNVSRLVSKNVSSVKSKDIIKNIVKPIQTKKQSEENFQRDDSVDDVQEEKLKTLKSIRDKLNFNKVIPRTVKPIDSDKSGILNGILGGALGSVLGRGKILGKGAIKGIGSVLSKGKNLVKKVGVGRLLKVGIVLKSGYDLINGIKSGIADYKKFKAAGDNVSANNVIFKTVLGSTGNLMNIAGAIIPGPIGWLLMAGGMFLDYTANNFDSIMSDKSNTIIQTQQKAARVQDLIDQGEKNQLLLLRPNIKNGNWEFKNYSTDEWEVLKDSSGKSLSFYSGKNRIEQIQKSSDGVQRYKLKSGNKSEELVLENGRPKIKDYQGNLKEITPRKDGGAVKKNNTYLVGEKGVEAYREKSGNQEYVLEETFEGINKSFKKMINNFNVQGLIEFFTPQQTTFTAVFPKNIKMTGLEMIDFSQLKDKSVRFEAFMKQLHKFEGGYSDRKSDKGGKTKFGITQSTWNAFGKDINPKVTEVKDITLEEAKKIYFEHYYKGGAENIEDPALAYVYFDTNVIMGPNDARRFLKESGGDVNKFLELRRQKHLRSIAKDATQAEHKGWFPRLDAMQNMFQKSVEQARIESVKQQYKQTNEQNVDVVDSDFLLNNVIPAMANAVSEKYNL